MILSRAISRQAYPRPPQAGRFNPALAQYSNAEPLFGKDSLEFTSNDGAPASFRLGRANLFPSASSINGQGTIEFWFYPTAGTTATRQLFRITEFATAITIFTASSNRVFARARFGAVTFNTALYDYNVNAWNHVAVTLDDNRFLTLWLNGERKETIGNGTDILVTSGGTTYGLWGGLFNGLSYRREFRVSKSVRYDNAIATYDVPTGPFVNDADTYMLFHLDGSDENAAGINQLIDDVSIQLPVITPITATGGDILEYEEGGEFYKSHTFNSSGTFNITALAEDGAFNNLDYLIVGGGGGGGSNRGAGGGAGGVVVGTELADVSAYTVIVGAGGAGGPAAARGNGTKGVTSSATGNAFSQSAEGGGFGSGTSNAPGGNGGSGGGGDHVGNTAGGIANGNFGVGQAGGSGFAPNAGGGGGAGGAGLSGNNTFLSAGGFGLGNTFKDGIFTFYAGGGGGGRGDGGASVVGVGGLGGGGNGAANPGPVSPATAGQVNTGGGGGGGNANSLAGAAGGSGIVIFRYKIPQLS